MDFSEQQELASREKVSGYGILWATLMGGMFVHGMPGPGLSHVGSWLSIMGRDYHFSTILGVILHYAVSAVYAWIIAKAIYRLPLLPAIIVGTLVAIGLYAINWMVFGLNSGNSTLVEMRVFLSHVLFGITASVAYKGASIPTVKDMADRPASPDARPGA